MKQLIFKAWVLTFNENWQEYKDGYVWIVDDYIVDVSDDGIKLGQYLREADQVIDAKGNWVLPGLVNAHTHLFQTFMRGLSDDKPLLRWLKEEIYPFSGLMEEEDFYLASLLGCLENLKNGATSVIDQHYVHTNNYNADRVLEAMERSGIRGYYCRCFANRLPHKPLNETKEHVLEELSRLKLKWHGKCNERLNLMVGPLNPWGVTIDLFIDTYKFAEDNNLLYQIHTAESQDVVQATVNEYGKTNVEFFEELGIMGPRTQLAHAVWLNEKEIEIVAQKGSLVVHNSICNMYLASGVAPVPNYRKMGIPVALATDGPGSNCSQDMMEVLKTTSLLHKIHNMDAMIFYPEDIIDMAVHDGAKAIGRKDIGMIKPGYKADLLMVNWRKSHIAPVHKANSALVYNVNGNDVVSVWVDGKLVVKDKKSVNIDEEALLEICQERALYIRNKANAAK